MEFSEEKPTEDHQKADDQIEAPSAEPVAESDSPAKDGLLQVDEPFNAFEEPQTEEKSPEQNDDFGDFGEEEIEQPAENQEPPEEESIQSEVVNDEQNREEHQEDKNEDDFGGFEESPADNKEEEGDDFDDFADEGNDDGFDDFDQG